MIVETGDAEGFARGRNLDKMGQHAADTSELFFDDVKVPAENVLGGVEGQRDFYQLMQQLPAERLVIANGAVAAIERAIQLTVDYTRERNTFGNAIFDYQNTQFKLAECKADWMAARAMVDELTQQLLRGELDANTGSGGKVFGARSARMKLSTRCNFSVAGAIWMSTRLVGCIPIAACSAFMAVPMRLCACWLPAHCKLKI